MEITKILKKPLITEKISTLTEKAKGGKERYAFIVDYKANKIQIALAIKAMYNVEVDSVNVINCKGKAKSRFTKAKVVSGRTNAYKKAIITVKEGEFIDIYANL